MSTLVALILTLAPCLPGVGHGCTWYQSGRAPQTFLVPTEAYPHGYVIDWADY